MRYGEKNSTNILPAFKIEKNTLHITSLQNLKL